MAINVTDKVTQNVIVPVIAACGQANNAKIVGSVGVPRKTGAAPDISGANDIPVGLRTSRFIKRR
jgi:hypothetical protein